MTQAALTAGDTGNIGPGQGAIAGGFLSGGPLSDLDLTNQLNNALIAMGVDISLIPYAEFQQLLEAVKMDPYIREIQTQGQAILAGTTTAMLYPFIQDELSNPAASHSPLLLTIGLDWMQRSGAPLNAAQQTSAQNLGATPSGTNPSVLTAIAAAAAATGVPYQLALSVAMVESGLNPNAVGDQGHSVGLFQLNDQGEGAGMSMQQREDPYTNALTALTQFAVALRQDPSLAQDPGRWAAVAQRPADPSAYAARVNASMTLGIGPGPSGGANASQIVPRPFDAPVVRSLQYGQTNPWGITVQWNEFSMPSGTPIYTPFAGQIVTQRDDQGWGTQVFVRMPNGYVFHVGHMNSLSVNDGQQVNPGDVLGESGGVPSQDGNHEWSTGAHVDLTLQDPSGHYVDPTMIFDSIFTGTATFGSLGMAGAEGSGVSSASAQDRLLGIDPVLEQKYPGAASQFENMFGRHPTAQELTNLVAATGGGQPDMVTQYLRNQPSPIQGISMGQYKDTRANGDSVSNSLYGHGITDGMIAEMAKEGISDPESIKFWLEQMDILGKMDPGTYQNFWKLNQPYMSSIYNQPNNFDPRIAQQQMQGMQDPNSGVQHTPPQQSGPPPQTAGVIVTQQGSNAPGFRI